MALRHDASSSRQNDSHKRRAHPPTGHSFYTHGGVAQYTRDSAQNGYRNSYRAYAAAPLVRQPVANGGWGHCVSGSAAELQSAYPSWDVC